MTYCVRLRTTFLFLALLLGGLSPLGLLNARQTNESATRVAEGVIAVKLKTPAGSGAKTGLASIDQLISDLKIQAVEQAFPYLNWIALKKPTTLDRLYHFYFNTDLSPWKVVRAFASDPNVDYAQPVYLYELDAPLRLDTTPNDPQYALLRHFDPVKAPAAWDIVKGSDGNVVIALVDGGTDWRHEDLRDNIWLNPNEIPGNGIDDDDNGFVDDVRGWNFANNTNDPTGLEITPESARHGTAVAGVAAAVSNNSIGVAGMSWNARLMPINNSGRTSSLDNSVAQGYKGIVYAAANGADIINCSWGSPGPPDFALNEAISFAIDQGALVVAAAGNGGADGQGDNIDLTPYYPASYRSVLTVGGTVNETDQKTAFSNYGVSVDVFAPSIAIRTTFPNNTYDALGGTSFAAPIVSGLAALVKTQHPEWTADQIREQIRTTADRIEGRNNGMLAGLLGRGRINALDALTQGGQPSIRVTNVEIVDQDLDGFVEPGEQVMATLTFTNFLADATGIGISVTPTDNYAQMLMSSRAVPSLATNEQITIEFSFFITLDVPFAHTLALDVDIRADDNYSNRDLLSLTANPPPFLDHDTQTIITSITAEGNIGWTKIRNDFASFGSGFIVGGRDLLFEGGIMMGTSRAKISDSVRGIVSIQQDMDFAAPTGEPLLIERPGDLTFEEGSIRMTDEPAFQPIGIEILQRSYADTAAANRNFIIFNYTIVNTNAFPINGLYSGLFFDWDINTDALDVARFDEDRRLGYVMNAAENPEYLAGTKLLSQHGGMSYISINNEDIYVGNSRNGFTASEKWRYLSSGIQTRDLDGIDVSTLTTAGPLYIKAGCSVDVSYAAIGTQNRETLTTAADQAQLFWDSNFARTSNDVPVFSKVLNDTQVPEGQTLEFNFEVDDADVCDNLEFTLLDPPANASILFRTGLFSFSPDFGQAGTYPLTVAVSDGLDSDTTRSTITVTRSNRPPLIVSALPDTTILAGSTFTFDFTLTDPENDTVTYRLENAPVNAVIDPITGRFIFSPGQDQTGTFRITVVANDGSNDLMLAATIHVTASGFRLNPAYPSPFTQSTTLEFILSEDTDVTFTLYDAMGRVIRTFMDRPALRGFYRFVWDGTNSGGAPVADGLYFGQLTTSSRKEIVKMLLLR